MSKSIFKSALCLVLIFVSAFFVVSGYIFINLTSDDISAQPLSANGNDQGKGAEAYDDHINNDTKTITLANGCGSARVLAVRIGFADAPLSDAASDTNITTAEIRNYFEGNDPADYPYESVPAYYERASYGQLSLSLGEIIDVELPVNRDTYSGKSGGENEYRLISDIINSPGVEEKLSQYDADGDGSPDLVYFFCNGEKEEKGSVWWPHCHTEWDDYFKKNGSVLNNYILTCKDQMNVMIHETGHLLDLPDYYSYNGYYVYDFSVPDMMNDNHGDHTGLSKWLAGWIRDENITFAYRENTGADGITVNLTPVDMPGTGGKKIAVISPQLAGTYGEYLLVEYISGSGNMSLYDGRRDYPEGFRIIHVFYNDEDGRLYANALTKDHTPGADFGVFKEGDSITPFTVPSSDFNLNGEPSAFSGINITDFVTGDDPQFRVSFTDEEIRKDPVVFEQGKDSLSNMLELTLTADRPLKYSNKSYGSGFVRLEKNGVIYPLVLKADEYNETKFYLEYRELTTPLLPDSDYTLVMPAGTFTSEEGEEMPETRLNIHTGRFTKVENIETVDFDEESILRSGLVSFKDSSAYVTFTGNESEEGTGFRFVRFGSGNASEENEFFISLPEDKSRIASVNVILSDDGNYVLVINTEKNTYVQKITPDGKMLSQLVTIPEAVDVIEVGTGFKGLATEASDPEGTEVVSGDGEFTGSIWSFDLKGEPVRKIYRYDAYISGGFIAIDDSHYCITGYDRVAETYYTDVYDKNDRLDRRISLSENLPLSVCADNGKINVVEIAFDEETGEEHFVIYIYDTSSATFTKKRLEGEKLDEMYLSGIKLKPFERGYVLFYRYSGKADISLAKMVFLNRDFEITGSLSLPGGADCIPQKDRVVVIWEDKEGRSMAWTEVLMSGNPDYPRETEGHGSNTNEKNTNTPDDGNGNDPGGEEPDIQNGESHIQEADSASGVNAVSTGVSDDLYLWGIIVIITVAGLVASGVYLFKRKRNN